MFYKSRGVDMTYMLGDPIFQRLPIEDRVAAIKEHAATILAGTPEKLNREERGMVWGETGLGALTGAGVGFSIGKFALSHPHLKDLIPKSKALALASGFALLGGAASGALIGRLKSDQLYGGRQALRSSLHSAAINPSTTNAIGVLSTSPLYSITSVNRHSLINAAMGKLRGDLGDNLKRGLGGEDLENGKGEKYEKSYIGFGGKVTR